MSALSEIKELKSLNQDYEFYPTTNEILKKVRASYESFTETHRHFEFHKDDCGFLDIGAGNGKVLDFFKDSFLRSGLYGIEKSQENINKWDADYFVLGVDFWKTTLIDKKVKVIFSNPPYKQYEEWCAKILKECPSDTVIYLVIPERWGNSQIIENELKTRAAKFEVKGEFSFENSEDRKSRANVHLLEIYIPEGRSCKSNDAFEKFFDKTFSYPDTENYKGEKFEEKITESKVVNRTNLIETLCILYEDRMQQLQKNYHAICSLEPEILLEFELNKMSLMESLRNKIGHCKKEYWERLFDGMNTLYTRLTYDSRRAILNSLNRQTGIDFNRENAYAVVLWAIKNANKYFDEQLITTYEKMVSAANIDNYVSNQRVFNDRDFHYGYYRNKYSETPTHFKLKVGHRIVLENSGGLTKSPWSFERDGGLNESAARFLGDLMTVAYNLGFSPIENHPKENEWDGSGAHYYHYTRNGEKGLLFKVRAFKNGNMHLHFAPEFILALNIQFGKLKGWLHNKEEIRKEILTNDCSDAIKDKEKIDKIVDEMSGYHFQIKSNQLLLK